MSRSTDNDLIAFPKWTCSGVSIEMPPWRCSALYQRKNDRQKLGPDPRTVRETRDGTSRFSSLGKRVVIRHLRPAQRRVREVERSPSGAPPSRRVRSFRQLCWINRPADVQPVFEARRVQDHNASCTRDGCAAPGVPEPAPRRPEQSFLFTPLGNNATLLSRMVYYHRLYDFDTLLQAHQGAWRPAGGSIAEDEHPGRFRPLYASASSPSLKPSQLRLCAVTRSVVPLSVRA